MQCSYTCIIYVYLTGVTVILEGVMATSNQTASPIPTKCKSSLDDGGHLDQVGKQLEHCYKSRNSDSTQGTADLSCLHLSVNVSLMVMSVCYLLYMNF